MSTAGDNSPRPRKSSQSSRFEIEKVDEKEKSAEPTTSQEEHQESHKSALKKTVKHYQHDDDFFDFNDEKQGGKASSKLLATQTSSDSETVKKPKGSNDSDDEATGCFQVVYNERNQPVSIVVNLPAANKNEATSYTDCVHDLKTITLYQKLIAEFLGTLLLTLYACSIGLPIAEENGVPSINGCLGGGLTLASLVWVLGSISGGHLNPAVTIAFLFTGKTNPLLAVLYIFAQLLGAYAGAALLVSLAPVETAGKMSLTLVHADISLAQAWGVEAIITFILVITVFSCVDSKRKDIGGSFPLQIGLAVVVGGLFGGKFTGGSMNPARSFGPALLTGVWDNHWVYWVGPVTGGVLAGILYTFVLRLQCPRKRTTYTPVARE